MALDLHLRVRAIQLLAAIAVAVLVTACQGGAATPTAGTVSPGPQPGLPNATSQSIRPPITPVSGTPGKTMNLHGQFAFVGNDGNLTLQNANTGEVSVLVPTGTQGYAQNPAFSPDGKEVAYSYSSFTKDGQVQSQIRVTDVQTKEERVLISPEDLHITVDLPAWSPDGKTIYVTVIVPTGQGAQRSEIDRVPASGGTMTKVVDDGFEVAVSPDGKRITFQRIDMTTFTAGLWIANSDGSEAKELMDKDTFAAIFGMRFSPDSQTILFAASGPAKKKLPGVTSRAGQGTERAEADPCAVAFLSICWVERAEAHELRAEAHGLPWDLWTVTVDGSRFERLTQIGADSPVPVWSTDGKTIAFFEATGIYLLDPASKGIYPISNTGGYGGFDWR